MTTVYFFNGGALFMPDDVVRDKDGNTIKVTNYVNLPGAPDYDPQRAWKQTVENFEKSVAAQDSEIDKYIYDKK